MVNPIRYTNRSGQISYQRCHRLGYLGQFYPRNDKRIGLDKEAKPFEMLCGVYAHEGLASLLRGDEVDVAVSIALKYFNDDIGLNGIITYGCDPVQVKQEAAHAIEGLIRGWAIKRLPYFQQEFEVIEVEQDHHVPLVSGPYEDVEFEFKPDAVLKHKLTGLIYVLSFKTTGNMDSRKQEDAKTDIQGLSEAWGVEQALGLNVHGIIMEYLMTGKKDISEWMGVKTWTQFTPLFRGWRDAATGQIAWRYQWDELDDVTGEVKTHRLGKKFQRITSDDVGGVKEWIEMLSQGKMFPSDGIYSDPLREMFVSIEYYRKQDDIDEWVESARAQELEVSRALNMIDNSSEETYVHKMRELFPMYRHSCNYPSKCIFSEICHGPSSGDPLMNGYQYRESHHKMQLSQGLENE